MTERNRKDAPKPLVSRVLAKVDEQLFDAWRSGDPAARAEAWERLWTTTYSWAVPFCRSMAPDDLTAREWAADAFAAARKDVEELMAEGFSWRGESQFAGVFGKYLKLRCLDCRRAQLRVAVRSRRTARDTDQDDLDVVLTPVPADEEHQIEAAQTREAIERMVERLAWCKEICGGRPKLEAIFEAREAYLRDCCVRAVVGVPNADSLSLDALVPLLDRQAVEASSEEMNRFTMAWLKISRGTLDTRLQAIKKLKDEALGPDAGVSASL